MRIVLDTNIFISAFIFAKKTKNYLDLIADSNCDLLYSDITFAEIKKVLRYEKFSKQITDEKVKQINKLFINGEKVEISKTFDISEHKDDNHFIDVAVNGNADYILSGDNHLLSIKEFKGIKIVTIKEFTQKILPKQS